MTSRTKRYKGHYGFKSEAEFLAYCRQQAAAGATVTTAELKMLLQIITDLGGSLHLFEDQDRRVNDPQLTPTAFVDSILSACDASNWDADRNTGDYYRGLRDAYETIHEIANEHQTAMYDWTKHADRVSTVR